MFELGKDPKPPRGQQRRSGVERRRTDERREEIRFELKNPRRGGHDRRCHQGWDERLLR